MMHWHNVHPVKQRNVLPDFSYFCNKPVIMKTIVIDIEEGTLKLATRQNFYDDFPPC